VLANKVLSCRLGETSSDIPDEERKQRIFASYLGQLTSTNFDALTEKMTNIEVVESDTLRGFVHQIFSRALEEPVFCELYSKLTRTLHDSMPRYANSAGSLPTIYRGRPRSATHPHHFSDDVSRVLIL
jgi:hypothetical protein